MSFQVQPTPGRRGGAQSPPTVGQWPAVSTAGAAQRPGLTRGLTTTVSVVTESPRSPSYRPIVWVWATTLSVEMTSGLPSLNPQLHESSPSPSEQPRLTAGSYHRPVVSLRGYLWATQPTRCPQAEHTWPGLALSHAPCQPHLSPHRAPPLRCFRALTSPVMEEGNPAMTSENEASKQREILFYLETS